RLRLLTDAEQSQLAAVQGGATPQRDAVAPLLPLPQEFERQVEQTPDQVALLFQEQRITYRELNRRANQLAAHLRSKGVGPDSLVGLCIDRSPEMIIGILGILKAGGAYVPLDPAHPVDRLRFMLEDAQITLLVTHTGIRDALPLSGVQAIWLDADGPEIA